MGDAEFLIEALAGQLRELLTRRGIADPALVGIHTGGVWIAERLRRRLGILTPLGQMDIAFYRDDFSRIGVHPQVRPSELPFDVDDRHIVLIDDVLYTGRTIRAALNELFDYGRPASVLLAVLVDRGGREVPIEANAIGTRLELPSGDQIQLSGPDPLQLHLRTT
ncbi:MAG: bifunctional pyr operon transcriptional regulator/uracil phosphoribosyltransferase PyrR [Candidatus Competibacteraceae bacterium]|nr:MAG: bifunctional pyr operon transcriptional regulator/uracil phosphoribosyltransferase PyrR [Candidatus Competibacteraceae bacterium]